MFYYERRYLVVQDERPARLPVAAENRKQTCQRPMILWPHWPKVLPDSIASSIIGFLLAINFSLLLLVHMLFIVDKS